jgi:hypothetical protein
MFINATPTLGHFGITICIAFAADELRVGVVLTA